MTLSEDKAGGKERQREREGSAAREHDDDNGRDNGPIDDGKTEAQRKFEEVQRRRVSPTRCEWPYFFPSFAKVACA